MKYYTNVTELLEHMKTEEKGRIAYRYWQKGNVMDITYESLVKSIETIADTLYNTIGERNVIAIYGDTTYEWMAVYLGILTSNNIVVTIDPKLMLQQKKAIFNEMGITYVFQYCHDEWEIQDILENCVQIKEIYQTIDFVHTIKEVPNPKKIEFDEHGLAQYMFTSGSTGKSKIAMFSYKNIASMMQIEIGEFIQKHDIVLSTLPMHHCFELSSQLVELNCGATICINDSQERFCENLRYFAPTVINVVPVQLEELVRNFTLWRRTEGIDKNNAGMNWEERKRFCEKFGSRLERIHSGGAVIRPELAKIIDYYGVSLIPGLGMTEMFGHCCNNFKMLEKPTSVGIPFLKAITIKLAEDGEILVNGPALMMGYYNRDRDEFFTEDGYYKTGDIGRIDDEGYLYIIGRKKNIILLNNGENVYPEELEALLCEIEEVRQAVVFERENQITALLSIDENASPTFAEEKVHELNKKLATYKKITNIFCMNQPFPKTAASKIDRQRLIKEFKENHTKEFIPLVTEKENYIAGIIQEVLVYEKEISANDNFFAIGGNSLLALAVAAKANINAQYLYEYPKIRDLAKAMESEEAMEIQDERYLNDLIAQTKYQGRKGALSHILLTGATGFLGAHVLYELVKRNASKVTCLVRTAEKLRVTYQSYFHEPLPSNVEIVIGDITEDRAGMEQQTYEALVKSVDTVVHVAANVNHLGDKETFMNTNYFGTKRMIEFCQDADAELHYVSSYVSSGVLVVPIRFDVKEFTEQVLFIGQEYKKNIYVHTKYLSEAEILKARTKGLRANIYRMGCLTSRKKDGVFQLNAADNGLQNRLRGFLKIGVLPNGIDEVPMDFTAVDECTDAFTRLIYANRINCIFHMFNPNEITMKELGAYYNKELRIVPIEEFDQQIQKQMSDKEIAEYGFYTDLIASSKPVHFWCEETVSVLKEEGFTWGVNDEAYIKRFIG